MKSMNSADKVLLGVFFAFLISWLIKIYYKDIVMAKMIFSIMEAALVGGIADWFAVSALFRKPLGFPWHTALIPRNRSNLIKATALMVQNDFFNRGKLIKIVEGLPLLEYLIGWVENGKGKYVLLVFLRNMIKKFLMKTNSKSIAEGLELALKSEAVNFKIVPVIQKYAASIVEKNQHQEILDNLIENLLEVLRKDSTKDEIIDYCVKHYRKEKENDNIIVRFFKSAGEIFGQIDPAELGEKLYNSTVILLENVHRDKEHSLRILVKQNLIAVTNALENDEKTAAAIEQWKNNIVKEAQFKEVLEDIISILSSTMNDSEKQFERMTLENGQYAMAAGNAITAWVITQLVCYWEAFKDNTDLRRQVDKSLKDIVIHLVDHEHDIIGKVVKGAMEKLTDDDLNQLIEERVGADLQFIRINGSLVGGMIGLVIFLSVNFINGM